MAKSRLPLRVLWLGDVASEDEVVRSPAVSPAANRWQAGLVQALQGTGDEVRLLGHRPAPLWPRGKAWMRGIGGAAPVGEVPSSVPQVLVPYWNVPGMRPRALCGAYLKSYRHLAGQGYRPDCIVSYNIFQHTLAIAARAKAEGIPWIPIIADALGDAASLSRMKEDVGISAGPVFLSWRLYAQWEGRRKLHLDGGVGAAPAREKHPPDGSRPRVIFYSGVLNEYGGIDLLLEAFQLIDETDARLWICGKGRSRKLEERLAADPRISFFGCVPEDKLRALSEQAWVMVNPRPSNVPGNDCNFPSKVLEYLSYGKPVVSTATPGVGPEYAGVLVTPRSETPGALAESICNVLGWSMPEREAHAARVRGFLEGKTWTRQAERLTAWILNGFAEA